MQSQYCNDTDAQVHIFALSTKWLTNSLVGFHMYIAYSFKCPFRQFCHLGFQNANRICIPSGSCCYDVRYFYMLRYGHSTPYRTSTQTTYPPTYHEIPHRIIIFAYFP